MSISTRGAAVPNDRGGRLPRVRPRGPSAKRYLTSGTHTRTAAEVGDSFAVVGSNETQQADQVRPNPAGTDDDEAHPPKTDAGSDPVKIEETIRRFVDNVNLFRDGTDTAERYAWAFRGFAKAARLERYKRRQLTPTRSRDLILKWVKGKPAKSRSWYLHAVKDVWVYGLRLPWPIDIRRDFGKSLPGRGIREAPTDRDVLPFAVAIDREPDPFLRVFVRMILTYGPRPADQLGELRWRHIRWDDSGRPIAIVALGQDEGFKTGSPWIGNVPPELAEELLTWKSRTSDNSPEALLLPWIPRAKRLGRTPRRQTIHSAERVWDLYKRRHAIDSKLTMAHMRHWVKRRGRKVLDVAILAYWQGHRASSEGGGMSRVYGTNLPVEEVLEEQAREWPRGPLGDLLPVKVRDEPRIPAEVASLVVDFLEGRLGSLQLATELEKARGRVAYLRR